MRTKTLKFEEDSQQEEKNDSMLESLTEKNIDFIKMEKTKSIKDTLKTILKTFNVSCCKIAVRIVREEENLYKFKFYIDKAFYYNTFKKLENKLENYSIISKYKLRGYELRMEDE